MTFTKERLTALSRSENVGAILGEEIAELARIALASREAEAVYQVCKEAGIWVDIESYDVFSLQSNGEQVRTLYSAPPAPVSVPAAMEMDDDFDSAFEHGKAVGWNAYRAAMLQSFGNSEQLNSPVIPDGWVMVPIEPTAEMLQSGISAHYERSQTQIHDRPAPGPMECAYVAMLAAAPQREVK